MGRFLDVENAGSPKPVAASAAARHKFSISGRSELAEGTSRLDDIAERGTGLPRRPERYVVASGLSN